MKLSKADESSLIIAVTDTIQRTEITNYEYARLWPKWEENILSSLSEDGAKMLKSKLDPSLEGLVQQQIFEKFYSEKNQLPAEGKIKLTSARGFSKPLEVARSIVEYISKAPYTYRMTMPCGDLFDSFDLPDDGIKISDRLLIMPAKSVSEIQEVKHRNSDLNKRIRKRADANGFVDKISEEGRFFVFFSSGIYSSRATSRHIRVSRRG